MLSQGIIISFLIMYLLYLVISSDILTIKNDRIKFSREFLSVTLAFVSIVVIVTILDLVYRLSEKYNW